MKETRQTILIVDDDEEIVDLLRDHFKRRNCETIATTDPMAVVDKLRNFSVKLMLLDLKMRNLDGFEVLDKVKAGGLRLPPTIIITGFLPKYQERLEAYDIDPEDVITKPFDFDMMEKAINRKLGQQIVIEEVGSEYEDLIYAKNRCRIGIVEDEKDILNDFSEFFEERHYKVSCFGDGNEAYEGVRKKPLDILFVDIKLPGMQGDQLIEKLTESPNPPYMIPISADPLPAEMQKKLKDLGCREFISKPFDIVELIERVKTIAIQRGLLG
ncbi:MAG TPA: response regulator [Candidatus Omnitrophota bacterium]|nr:response regulator [Candidatus Omnitrophota bacterium]